MPKYINTQEFLDALRGLGLDTEGLYEVHADLKSISLKRRIKTPSVEGTSHVLDSTEIVPLAYVRKWDDD